MQFLKKGVDPFPLVFTAGWLLYIVLCLVGLNTKVAVAIAFFFSAIFIAGRAAYRRYQEKHMAPGDGQKKEISQ